MVLVQEPERLLAVADSVRLSGGIQENLVERKAIARGDADEQNGLRLDCV